VKHGISDAVVDIADLYNISLRISAEEDIRVLRGTALLSVLPGRAFLLRIRLFLGLSRLLFLRLLLALLFRRGSRSRLLRLSALRKLGVDLLDGGDLVL